MWATLVRVLAFSTAFGRTLTFPYRDLRIASGHFNEMLCELLYKHNHRLWSQRPFRQLRLSERISHSTHSNAYHTRPRWHVFNYSSSHMYYHYIAKKYIPVAVSRKRADAAGSMYDKTCTLIIFRRCSLTCC